jgi:hypothetical protein
MQNCTKDFVTVKSNMNGPLRFVWSRLMPSFRDATKRGSQMPYLVNENAIVGAGNVDAFGLCDVKGGKL